MTETLITAEDLLARLRERGTPLPYEFGVFITLEAVEATVDRPRVLAAADVLLNVDGAIRVSDSAPEGSAEAAARSAVALLGALLAASGPGVPPLLLRLVEQGPSNGEWNPSRLRDELFTALVPLNRGASRRVLARMIRDASRPPSEGKAPARSEPPLRATDDDLASLLGEPATKPTELPVESAAEPADDTSEVQRPVEELPEQSTEVVHVDGGDHVPLTDPPNAPTTESPTPNAFETPETSPEPEASFEALPALSPDPGDDDEPAASERPEPASVFSSSLDAAMPEAPRHSRPASATIRPVVYLALAAGVALAAYRFGQVGSPTPLPPAAPVDHVAAPPTLADAEVEAAAAEPAAPAPVPVARKGSVVLTTASGAVAQFLRFEGRAPLRVEGMPRRSESELVIVDDGAPAVRLRITQASDWDDTAAMPLLELGFTRIDTTAAPVSFADLDLGAPANHDSLPSAEAAVPGAVRIVSTPRGAKVYRMLGTTDRLVLEGVDPAEPLEFLVQAEGTFVEKVVIGPSDWQTSAEGGAPEARLQVVLRTRTRSAL